MDYRSRKRRVAGNEVSLMSLERPNKMVLVFLSNCSGYDVTSETVKEFNLTNPANSCNTLRRVPEDTPVMVWTEKMQPFRAVVLPERKENSVRVFGIDNGEYSWIPDKNIREIQDKRLRNARPIARIFTVNGIPAGAEFGPSGSTTCEREVESWLNEGTLFCLSSSFQSKVFWEGDLLRVTENEKLKYSQKFAKLFSVASVRPLRNGPNSMKSYPQNSSNPKDPVPFRFSSSIQSIEQPRRTCQSQGPCNSTRKTDQSQNRTNAAKEMPSRGSNWQRQLQPSKTHSNGRVHHQTSTGERRSDLESNWRKVEKPKSQESACRQSIPISSFKRGLQSSDIARSPDKRGPIALPWYILGDEQNSSGNFSVSKVTTALDSGKTDTQLPATRPFSFREQPKRYKMGGKSFLLPQYQDLRCYVNFDQSGYNRKIHPDPLLEMDALLEKMEEIYSKNCGGFKSPSPTELDSNCHESLSPSPELGMKTCAIEWFQTSKEVYVRLMIPDVKRWKKSPSIDEDKKTLSFATADPSNYGMTFVLSRKVELSLEIELFGQYVKIMFKKRLPGLLWKRLLCNKSPSPKVSITCCDVKVKETESTVLSTGGRKTVQMDFEDDSSDSDVSIYMHPPEVEWD